MKTNRIPFAKLGISSTPTISSKYWEKKKADQERWAKEGDQTFSKSPVTVIRDVKQPKNPFSIDETSNVW